jgi:hypothetical protein
MAISIQDAAIIERITIPVPTKMEGPNPDGKSTIRRIMKGFVCGIERNHSASVKRGMHCDKPAPSAFSGLNAAAWRLVPPCSGDLRGRPM